MRPFTIEIWLDWNGPAVTSRLTSGGSGISSGALLPSTVIVSWSWSCTPILCASTSERSVN